VSFDILNGPNDQLLKKMGLSNSAQPDAAEKESMEAKLVLCKT
jgi:hypothetical protein